MGRFKGIATILEIAVRNFYKHRCPFSAAGLAFYGMFSGLPLLLLSVILATTVLRPEQAASRIQEVLSEYIPLGSRLIEDTVEGAVKAGGAVAGVSLVALLWSGTRVFAHSIRALNDAWGVEHGYAIRTRFIIEPLLVVGMVGMISLSLLYQALPGAGGAKSAGPTSMFGSGIGNLLEELLSKGLGFVLILLLYRYLPRRKILWRDALAGALVAMLLLQGIQELFESYVGSYGDKYVDVYGPLSAVAVVLVWAYITASIFLFGAEVSVGYCNYRAGRTRREDAPVAQKVSQAS